MSNRQRLTSRAVDEALDARFATQRLIETIDAAISDGVVDAAEAAQLDQLTAHALGEGREAVHASQRADTHAWAIHALECGRLDTRHMREQARDLGINPDELNALVDANETAAG